MVSNVRLPVDGIGKIVRTAEVIIDSVAVHEQVIRTSGLPLAQRIDEYSATVMYVGYGEVGSLDASAVWQIKKVETIGTETRTEWASSNGNYDKIWNNRTGYVYG